MLRTCTRRLEFDAAHRLVDHEGKCKNLHGHRYVVEVMCTAPDVDGQGRVIDFGVVKELVGGWIDRALDHGAILSVRDCELKDFCRDRGWKFFVMECNPSAENIAEMIYRRAREIMAEATTSVCVARVRVYETPNCWADFP